MENKKSNKLLIIVIIVLLIIIAILAGILIYNSQDKSDKPVESNSTNENAPEEPTEEKIAVDDPIVVEAMNSFRAAAHYTLFEKDIYSVDDMTNEDLVATAVMNLEGDNIAYCVALKKELKKNVVSYEELNKTLNKYVYGKEITPDMIKKLEKADYNEIPQYLAYGYGVVLYNNGVKLTGPCDYGLDSDSSKTIDASLDGDNLYVYEKIVFVTCNEEDDEDYCSYVDYYKDSNHKEVVEKKVLEDKEPNWDLYNTYKFTFKKINDIYYFQTMELVK